MERLLQSLLAETSFLWKRVRRQREEEFDLRPLVRGLRVTECQRGTCVLCMRLRAGQQGMVRPDDVLKALGVEDAGRVVRLDLAYE